MKKDKIPGIEASGSMEHNIKLCGRRTPFGDKLEAYDTIHLVSAQKQMGSQLNLPHENTKQ